MRRPLVILSALAVVLVSVQAASAGSGVGDVRFFRTEAKDTYCVASFYPGSSPSTITCSSRVPLARPTPKGPPNQCIGDPGNGLLVNHRGRAHGYCTSQSPFAGPTGRNYVGFHVLRYGKTMSFHSIHCHAVSRKLGIRCVNAVGHGFRMGGGTWRLF
jgi:hypothetical protein